MSGPFKDRHIAQAIPRKWMTRCLIGGASASALMSAGLNLTWWSQVVDVENARTIGVGMSFSNYTASAGGLSPTITFFPTFSSKDDGQLFQPTGLSGLVEGAQANVSYVVSALSTGNWRLWTWPAIGDQFRLRVTSNLGPGETVKIKNWQFFQTT